MEKEPDTNTESDIKGSQSTQSTCLLAIDLHLELNIIHHRASLKLLQRNAGETHWHTDNRTHWLLLRMN